jgi:biotin carboxylase
VNILARKDLFRKFLKENKFNCPQAISFSLKKDIEEQLAGFTFPLIIKPVDSSGSKGVCKVQSLTELGEAFDYSLSYSKEKKVIIEEFIEMGHECMIAGDIFVIDGKLDFCGLLNSHRDPQVSPYVPIGTSYPVFIDDQKAGAVKKEIQKIVDFLHIKSGAMNLEFMFGKNGKLYPIELGPRNGGNMIPELLHMTYGYDSIRATVECALGNCPRQAGKPVQDLFLSTYVVHAAKPGFLKEIIYHDDIKKNIFKKITYKKEGEYVEKFEGANKALDILFLQYQNLEELQYKMRSMNQYIEVRVE